MTTLRNRPIRPWTVRRQRRRRTIMPKDISFLAMVGSAFVFLLGLSTSFTVQFVGALPVSEVLVGIVALPLLIINRQRALRKDVLPIYMFMGLWLLGQMLTDIYRRSATIDWLRGDAAICFFVLDLVLIVMLVGGNDLRKVLFIAGFSMGSLLAFRVQPSELAQQAPWKFGLSGGTNLLVVLASAYFFNRRRYFLALLLLAGIGGVNLLEDYRSPVLLLLLTITLAVPVIPEQVGPWRVLPPPGTRMRLVVLASMALAASLGAGVLVQFLAGHGYLGDEAQQKNESQSRMKGGILLGGRPEILVSSRAVLESPILGHGSWAKDFKYIEMLNDTMIENGMDAGADVDALEEDSEGVIPAHSHIMGAWIWAGILGALFWAVIFRLFFRATLVVAIRQPKNAPLYMFLFASMLWDILFSPFGMSRRIVESVLIVMALDLLAAHVHALDASPLFRPRVWRRHIQQPALSGARAAARNGLGDERSQA